MMNKRGEGGLGLSTETLIKIVLTILVLVALWSLFSNLIGIFISDKEKADLRNFERLVSTMQDMEDGITYTTYPVSFSKDVAVVGWESNKNANIGKCDYGTIEAVTIYFASGLPKPPACGSGLEGCLCLCDKTSNYEAICQDSIIKCTTVKTADGYLSFAGCPVPSDHNCNFGILLGTDKAQTIYLHRNKDVIEFSLFGCDRYNVNSESSLESNYAITEGEGETFARIDAQYSNIIDKSVAETPFSHALIVGLIYQESKGNSEATSESYCKGIMQFCASTAYQYGLCDASDCSGTDYRTDPEKAIPAGIKRLFAGYNYFNHYSAAIEFSLASYNGGEAVIKKAIQATGKEDPTWIDVSTVLTEDMYTKSSPYFDTAEKREKKIKQIRNYVPTVLSYAAAYASWKESQTAIP